MQNSLIGYLFHLVLCISSCNGFMEQWRLSLPQLNQVTLAVLILVDPSRTWLILQWKAFLFL